MPDFAPSTALDVAPPRPSAAPGGPPATVPPAGRPPTTSFFGPQWSGPAAVGPAVVIGAAVTGIVAAAALTWDAPGLGWLITAVVGALAVLTAAGRQLGAVPAGVQLERGAWALAALALTATGTLRAAGWLFLLCLLALAACLPMGLVVGRSVRAIFLGAAVLPLATLRALPWALRGFGGRRSAGRGSASRTTTVVLVSLGLVLVLGALLAGADPVFASTLDLLLPTVDATSVLRWAGGFLGAFLLTIGLSFLAVAPPTFDNATASAPRPWRRIEWGLPVGAMGLLYAGFVAVQATVLFGGDGYVQRTAGVSYAEYARGGFWQLSAVTVVTLLVIGIAAYRAARETAVDRAWMRGLLGTLALLTLVIVASAVSRMWAYETAYGFTRLRLLVGVCELWLGLVFVLVLGAGVRLRHRASWLPRAVVGTAVAALLGIVALNPDGFIARENVSRFQATNRIDLAYLSELSADAVPALAGLPEPQRSCALAALADELARPDQDPWQHANLARAQARRILAGLQLGPCPPELAGY